MCKLDKFQKLFSIRNEKLGSLRCFSINESKKQLKQSLSKSKIFFRSSHQRCSVKKVVHKKFATLTGKHLRWSLFNKVAGFQACNFTKKRLQHRCFPVIKAKFLRTPMMKDLCKWLLPKIYPVLLFWFLEDTSEVAVCHCSIGKHICQSLFPITFLTFCLKFYQI